MSAFGAATPRRIDTITRVVAVIIALAAIAAFGVLFLVPERTDTLFSWTIRPTMTARLMGAGYLAGAYLFARTALGLPWPTVRAPILGLVLFNLVTLGATVLHLDRFHQGHLAFYLWMGLYAFLAVATPLLWLANEAVHPRQSDLSNNGSVMSSIFRRVAAAAGVGALLLAASLFVLPDVMSPNWPWAITPLTARAMSAWYATAGVTSLVLATESAWANWRRAIEAAIITLGLILMGAALGWAEFDLAKPLTWIFLAGTAGSFLAVLILYISRARRRVVDLAQPAG
jgi:hypothetical protein